MSPYTRNRKSLRHYQNWLIDQIEKHPFLYLAVDMGLGKTISVLTALLNLQAAGEIAWPVLIVAPKLVATDTWPDEVLEWEHTRHLTVTVLVGTPEEREAARLQRADLHVINYENFQWLREKWGRKWPYRVVVIDEATRIKAGKKRTKAPKGARADGSPRVGRRTSRFGAIARVRGLLDRVIMLSGTPAPAGLHDLWGPMYILDRGERLGTSLTAFENRWFQRNVYAHTIEPHAHSHAEIMSKVSDLMFSLKGSDYLELPPVIPVKHLVELPPKIMRRYKDFERELYDEITDVEAVSAGVLVNKLLQFANGSLYVDDDRAEFVHDLKLDVLDSIVTEANGEPILLAYEFRFDLPAIQKRFPKARIIGDTKTWKDDWNAGRIPILITHPATAGHGLNIQKGGHIQVWYGLTSSLELFLQFNARLERSGQQHDHVIRHFILAKGTEDERQLSRMTEKGATQNAITDAVRVRLGRGT